LQRRLEQQTEAQRASAVRKSDVFTAPGTAMPLAAEWDFPEESPCFRIRTVHWAEGQPPAWLQRSGARVLGHCIGGAGLQQLQRNLQFELVDRGYVTSMVLVPEQSVSAGALTLRYVAGTIGSVDSTGAPGWWRMALPTGPGGVVDQRDLDQALENLRRLTGQADATIELVPGEALGASNLVLRPGTGKRWQAYVGGDNGGLAATGEYQVNAGLTLDSPLFLYDRLSVAWNTNADRGRDDAGTRSGAISYSIPFGYWSIFGAASRSTYHQTLQGFQDELVYAGVSKQIEGGVSVVPYRGTRYKGTATARMFRKWSHNRIDDIDIAVQHRDVVGYQLDVAHRHYLGSTVLDAGLGWRSTLPGMSKAPGVYLGDPHWNGRSAVVIGTLGALVPFNVAQQRMAFQSTWRWQHARTPLLPSDYLTIGTRYAVRGFDGQKTLAAESGWVWRNDLSLNLGDTGQQLYTGLDAGRVRGRAARYYSGRTLVGAVIGARGRVPMPGVAVNYDLSVGWPLRRPDTLRTAQPTVAFSVMMVF